MKKFTSALILVSQLFFGSSLLANTDGMAVIDYQAIFFGTDAARQAFEELKSLMNIKKSPMILPSRMAKEMMQQTSLRKMVLQCLNPKKQIFIKRFNL